MDSTEWQADMADQATDHRRRPLRETPTPAHIGRQETTSAMLPKNPSSALGYARPSPEISVHSITFTNASRAHLPTPIAGRRMLAAAAFLLLATQGLCPTLASADDDGPEFEGESIVAVEVDFRWDLGSMTRTTTVDRNPFRDERSDLSGYGATFRLMYLKQRSEHLSLGGAFEYSAPGDYTSEGDVDQDPYSFGQQLAFDFRIEPRVTLTEGIELITVLRTGLVMIVPGGDLAEEIRDNQNAGLNTWDAPRLGILIGADVGLRWRPDGADWVAVRATFGYAWQHVWLMNSRGSTGPIDTHDKWGANLSRIRVGAGAEFIF